MRLVLADPALLKDSISVISDLVSEARFKVSRDGLELTAMDPANVAMVVFKLLSSSFTEYELAENAPTVIFDKFRIDSEDRVPGGLNDALGNSPGMTELIAVLPTSAIQTGELNSVGKALPPTI